MRLFDQEFSRREIQARLPRLEAMGGIRRLQCGEGLEKNTELIQVRTGAGLCYYVNADRALDISLAEYRGAPLSWHAPSGDIHPAYYNPSGIEWLRTAAGGLLMTCGLTQVGSACTDNDEELGVHGRIHHLPARHVAARGEWKEDDYIMDVSGTVEQTRLFGEHLRLCRSVSSRMGENTITLKDRIENGGFECSPLMILYHFNFGFPLMTEKTVVDFPCTAAILPREPDLPMTGIGEWQVPEPGYAERVYYHQTDTAKTEAGMASVVITNPDFAGMGHGVSVCLKWNTRNLPNLVQWKMPGSGIYALGIEPANCRVAGRAAERDAQTLTMIEPGQTLEYHMELAISDA